MTSPNMTKASHYMKQCWPSVRSSDIPLRVISQGKPHLSITKISFKITFLKFNSYLPGTYGLNYIYNRWYSFTCLHVYLQFLVYLFYTAASLDLNIVLFLSKQWIRNISRQ